MKKLLFFVATALLLLLGVFYEAHAAATSWDFAGGVLQPLQSQWSAQIKGSYFTATSTTASTFPYASTTAISSSNLSSGNCVQASTGGLLTTTGAPCGTGSGTVTQINTTFPILGGPITTTGTLTFGGLSTSSPGITSGQPLYATGVNTIASVASSTFLTSIGGQAAGNYVITSSGETSTFIPFWTSTAATPPTLSGGVADFTFNSGNQLSIPSNGWYSIGGKSFAYASSTVNRRSVFLGFNTGNAATTTGINGSVAIGYGVLASITNGAQNIGIGTGDAGATGPLGLTTSGSGNVAVGSAVGFDKGSLGANTTGGRNVAIGAGSLSSNQTGYGAVALGYSALGSSNSSAGTNITGNIGIGHQAGFGLTSGLDNILIGSATSSSAIANLTTGSQNISIGSNISFPSATASGQLNIQNIIFGINNTITGSGVSTGNIGIGTTSPWKLLAVGNSNAGTFAVSTSTGGCAQFSSSGELYSTGSNCGTGSGGITAIGPTGQTQTGATITIASSTSSFNGLTIADTIVGATNTLTWTPSLSGLLAEGGGGTHQSTYTKGDILYASAANTLSKLGIGTGGFVLSSQNGVPTWVATSSINNGVSSIVLPQGSFTGNLTFATSTSATNGIISALAISGSGSTLTFTPSQSGTLTVAGGGTGDTTFTSSQLLYGNGTNALSSVATSSFAVSSPLSYSGTLGSLVGGAGGTLSLGTVGLGNGGTATTTFYSGGVVYSDGSKLTQATGSGNSIFTWDNTNGRLGIGSSTPSLAFSLGSSFGINSSGQVIPLESRNATSTSATINWANTGPSVLYQNGTSATTLFVINATTTQFVGSRKMVTVCEPGTTGGAVTWVGVEWAGGTVPTQTTTANQCDIYSFYISAATSTSASPVYKVFGAASTGFQ